MIKGIGNDIIEVERLKKAIEKENFLKRYFTDEEIKYISKNSQTAAGIFAAKEAVSKAIGTGFRGFMPKDIEITHDLYGKPKVSLFLKADNTAKNMGIKFIHISISHCKNYAAAFAVAEGE